MQTTQMITLVREKIQNCTLIRPIYKPGLYISKPGPTLKRFLCTRTRARGFRNEKYCTVKVGKKEVYNFEMRARAQLFVNILAFWATEGGHCVRVLRKG